MQVEFKDKKLQEMYETSRGIKGFPADLVKPFIKTVNFLKDAKDIKDLEMMRRFDFKPCNFYKEGYYGVKVNDQFRLFFTLHEDILILIMECIDYHDKI